jgi:PAS domain S-box-containing protein
LVHPDDLARVEETQLLVGDGARVPLATTYRMRRKDGSYVWFETNSEALEEDGGVTALQTTSRDVTERIEALREAERARADAERAQARAEEADRAKSAFLASMSH